jgi:hypothetical protein
MALQKNFDLPTGINLPEAYIRISTLGMDLDPSRRKAVSITVQVFADKECRDELKLPVASLAYGCSEPEIAVDPETGLEIEPTDTTYADYFSTSALSVDGVNIISNAYAFLKGTQALFNDAMDC